ncbi:phosphate ABC transporter substrate-binding protein [Desulfolutivibrio sp.]|uniref:phosphate ABC transporter substrate-binding protein n=1 Tax=Desulfolutivibrio sp. TaxID=2773296 RepID=UPI002F96BE87
MPATSLRRTLALFAAALCLLASQSAFAAGLDAFKGLSGNLDIAGGTAHIPVMKDAAKAVMEANPAVTVTIAAGGSGVGVQKAGEGLAAIGNTGRALTDEEVAKYGLVSFPFAIDGVAVVVNPENGVAALTSQQVKDIFAGKIANWKDVSGADAAITLYTRDEASGTREVFWEKLLKKGDVAATANVVASNGAMKVAVGKDKNGIGYVSIGHLDATVKAPALDGVVPDQQKASNGAYPVTRKLYMNTKGQPTGLVKAFIDYILGPDGKAYIIAAGYIPLN